MCTSRRCVCVCVCTGVCVYEYIRNVSFHMIICVFLFVIYWTSSCRTFFATLSCAYMCTNEYVVCTWFSTVMCINAYDKIFTEYIIMQYIIIMRYIIVIYSGRGFNHVWRFLDYSMVCCYISNRRIYSQTLSNVT